MTNEGDYDYYLTRERQERGSAAVAATPGIASIHLQMAEDYRALAIKALESGPEPAFGMLTLRY
jgi:hypothetical protein